MNEGILKPKGSGITLEWGTKISLLGFSMKDGQDVVTYKCKRCGYLETYAK